MPEYLTTVLEIREAGIVLPSQGDHVVRVLGAAKEVARPGPLPPKEELAARADRATYDAYYAGTLGPPAETAETAEAAPEPTRVPVLFLDDEGHPYLLRRR
jgi:hypothetical protein